MGLSNEERHQKIIWSVSNLTSLGSQINKEEGDHYWDKPNPYLEIKKIIAKLWPCLLANNRNGGFWLMGTDHDVEKYKQTLWSTAISARIEDIKEDEEDWKKERRAQRKKDEELEIFDIQEHFKLEALLDTRSKVILDVQGWLENIQYASNRYEDEVSEEYKELNELVAMALGQLFVIFYEKQFTKAWLIHEIALLLFDKTFMKKKKEADPLQLLVDKDNYHHDVKSALHKKDIKDLRDILKDLTLDSTVKNRTIVTLKLIGSQMALYKARLTTSLASCVELKITKKFAMQYLVAEKKEDPYNLKDYRDRKKEAREDLLGIKHY